MTATKAKRHRMFDNVPTQITPLMSQVGKLLGRPTRRVGSCDSQIAATSIGYTIEVWPVTDTEFRSVIRRGIECQDSREVQIGYVVCETRRSRWQGEGVTQEWSFHPGDCPDTPRMIDTRFGEAVESRDQADPVEFWMINEFLSR
jgi:hypothetical protein